VLFRLLRHLYGAEHVTYVRNITDVDDKINARAAERGISIRTLTEETYANFKADVAALGCLPPTAEPRATEHIEEMKVLIERLVASGHAYVADGHVLFDVPSMPDYGRLARRSLDEMIAGARVDPAPYKRDPMDFVLWKPSKPGEPSWPSPCGIATPGRPGWHIECSAMAEQFLGVGFDIHGGGSDLVFPHHENEAAQTRAARSEELAKLWMHNGMIQFTGEKMAKSVGNIALLHEVISQYGSEAVVMYLVSGHYRQPLAFSEAALEQAQANVKRVREAGRRLSTGESPSDLDRLRDSFFDALARDFNTAQALSVLNEWIREATSGMWDSPGDAHLREMLGVLGLESLLAAPEQAPEQIHTLAEQREQARSDRDFAAADRLRDELAALGWEVRDGPNGFDLIPL
jgi:cysteinyl-tRNA synthetase